MEKGKPLKTSVSYRMKFPISKIWQYWREAEQIKEIIPETGPEITYLNDKKSYEKGSEYILHFTTAGCKLYAKVEEVVDTPTIKMMKSFVKTSPYEIKYDYYFALFANTVENTTTIHWEQVLKDVEIDKNNLPFYEIWVEDTQKKNIEYLDKMKKKIVEKIF